MNTEEVCNFIANEYKTHGPKVWTTVSERMKGDPNFFEACRKAPSLLSNANSFFRFGNVVTLDDFVPKEDRICIPKSIPDPELNYLMGNIGFGNRESPQHAAFYHVDNLEVCIRQYLPNDQGWLYYLENGDLITDNAYWTRMIAINDKERKHMACVSPDIRYGIFSHPHEMPTVTGPCITLFGRKNYFHFIIDYLPFIFYSRICKQTRNLPILMTNLYPVQKGIMEAFDINPRGIELLDSHITGNPCVFRFQDAYVPSHVPLSDRVNLLRMAIKADALPKGEKMLFISRHHNPEAPSRLSNTEPLQKALENYGFETVFAEDLSVLQQRELFSKARVIVGVHGAGLTNVIFAPRSALLIEIMNEVSNRDSMRLRDCFRRICAINGQSYLRMVCPVDEGQEMKRDQDLFTTCDPDKLLRLVEATLNASAI